MKNRIYKIIVTVLYVLSILILSYCIKIRFSKDTYLETNSRLIILFTVCFLIYIAGFILVGYLNNNKRILKLNLIIYTLIYTVMIFTLTLFDDIFGRQGFVVINWNKELFDSYIKTSFNIIPFKTIKLYLTGYYNNLISFRAFNINILGNLFAFMPYGIFFPLIFKGMNKYKNFLITMVIMIVIIELSQFYTMSGSCDIDDLILNLFGASIIYFITRIKCVNEFIHKIFLFE